MTGAQAAGFLAVALVAVNVACIIVAGIRLHRRGLSSRLLAEKPPVSIVRPMRGLETFSRETLKAGLELDYPAFETIFCVADANDPIIPLIEELTAGMGPDRVRLIVGDVPVSANPKLNNCVRGWNAARHDWVIIADSNVLMPRDYVQQLMAGWQDRTGLVCSTPAGSRPEGFWAEVECAFLNSFQARWQYAGEAIGLGFAQGKSMLWNKPFLESNGGIAALGAEIAEDAAATKLVRAAGRRVHLVRRPFEQPLGRRSRDDVVLRQFRWARLRRVTFLPFYLPEILIAPLVPAALATYAAPTFGVGAGWGALIVLGIWYGAEIVLARSVGWFLSWRTPLAFLARDLVFPAIWLSAFIVRKVNWRGNQMKIRTDGEDSLSASSGSLT
jgi:ceramide glucosyltransferase